MSNDELERLHPEPAPELGLHRCGRCKALVRGVYRHARIRGLARAYLFIPVLLVPIFPIAASDYFVCLPLMMVYMLGIGPVLSIVREPATCPHCDAFVGKEWGSKVAGRR